MLSTSVGFKSSLPSSCRITSAGKARSKRKKQVGWNHGFKILQNTIENNQGENNIPNCDKGSESLVLCEPNASKGHISLCFSTTSGDITNFKC